MGKKNPHLVLLHVYYKMRMYLKQEDFSYLYHSFKKNIYKE